VASPRTDPRDLAAEALLRLERRGGRLRAALDAARRRLGDARDRGLLTELCQGTVRRRGTLDALLATRSSRPLARLDAPVRVALRLALDQALFLDRVPVHAAVDHAVGWCARQVGARPAGYVNGVLRALLRDVEGPARGPEDPRRDVPREDGSALRLRAAVFADPERDAVANLAARYAMPAWLLDRWQARWGIPRAAAIARAGITRPPVTLRARIPRADLEARLAERGVAFRHGPGPDALLPAEGEAARRMALRGDEAVVQDATSQRVAPLLAPRAGEALLDLCAAPGGKSLHLADLLGRGRLVACDVDARKLARLEALPVPRDGLAFECVKLEREGPLPFAPGSFDAVLVDAPCSNTGVLRRRVEARWRLGPRDVDALAALQGTLLDRCVPVLAPGGRIVYSTCSLEPEEDEDVLAAFLARHPDFEGETAFRVWPGREADGGYAALLRAPGGAPGSDEVSGPP
jgi:16S rRNA (cytosine967-C5)-methyltransferase